MSDRHSETHLLSWGSAEGRGGGRPELYVGTECASLGIDWVELTQSSLTHHIVGQERRPT